MYITKDIITKKVICVFRLMFVLKFAEPPPASTPLQQTIIAENTTDGIKVYRFTWELPADIDVKHLNFQLDNESFTLTRNSTEIILPLSYGEHNVSVVIVDRCCQLSEANALQLDVMKGESICPVYMAQSKLEYHSCQVYWLSHRP